LGRLSLNVVFGACNACEGGEELKDREQGVLDMVMVGGFVALGEATGEGVVTMEITKLGAKRARRRCWSVKKSKAEFSTKKEAVCIWLETVVGEAEW
jgi:hypothetical protein